MIRDTLRNGLSTISKIARIKKQRFRSTRINLITLGMVIAFSTIVLCLQAVKNEVFDRTNFKLLLGLTLPFHVLAMLIILVILPNQGTSNSTPRPLIVFICQLCVTAVILAAVIAGIYLTHKAEMIKPDPASPENNRTHESGGTTINEGENDGTTINGGENTSPTNNQNEHGTDETHENDGTTISEGENEGTTINGGKNTSQTNNQNEHGTDDQSKEKKNSLWIAIVVCCAIVIIAVIVFIVKRKRNSKKVSENNFSKPVYSASSSLQAYNVDNKAQDGSNGNGVYEIDEIDGYRNSKTSLDLVPQTVNTGEPKIFGLPNFGKGLRNACYLNASLQCLVHTLYPFLSSDIMQAHLKNCTKSQNKECFTCLLSELSHFNDKTTEKKTKQDMQSQILKFFEGNFKQNHMNDCSEFLIKAYDEIKDESKSKIYLRESGTLLEIVPRKVEQNSIENENSGAEEHENLSTGDERILEIFKSMIEQLEQSFALVYESKKDITEKNQEIDSIYANVEKLEKEIEKLENEPLILKEYKNTAALITLITTFKHNKISTIHPEESCLLQIKKEDKTLVECLGKYFNDKINEEFRAKIQILQFPKYIGIHINNQKNDPKTSTTSIDKNPIEFEEILDFTKYAHEKLKKNREEFKYKLKAMIYFATYKHYFSCVKSQNKWYEIDDNKYCQVVDSKKIYNLKKLINGKEIISEESDYLPAVLYYEKVSFKETR